MHTGQLWPNDGEAAAAETSLELNVELEVKKGQMLLLPQCNYYEVTINGSLEQKSKPTKAPNPQCLAPLGYMLDFYD